MEHIQDKIDRFIDANFFTKSAIKSNMHNKERYTYLFDYLIKLYALRAKFGENTEKSGNYTIRDKGRISTEIFKIQAKLYELAVKLNIVMPDKYKN